MFKRLCTEKVATQHFEPRDISSCIALNASQTSSSFKSEGNSEFE